MSEIDILRSEIRELKAFSLISQKEALNIDEAVIITGLSKQTLYTMCRNRTIPYYKSKGGKKSYFKKSDLTDWMLHERVDTLTSINEEATKIAYLGN